MGKTGSGAWRRTWKTDGNMSRGQSEPPRPRETLGRQLGRSTCGARVWQGHQRGTTRQGRCNSPPNTHRIWSPACTRDALGRPQTPPRRGENPLCPHRQPTHSTEFFLASLCPVEQDVRAARRNMLPVIWTPGRTCGGGEGQRKTEMVRGRDRRGRTRETHTQYRDEKQRSLES